MQRNPFLLTSTEKERLFLNELVKRCVPYDRAREVARILASGEPDEELTEEEIQLAKAVCREWLERHKRSNALRTALSSLSHSQAGSRR